MLDFLDYLSFYSELLPIIFFLLFLGRNKKERLWIIFLYSISSFTVDFFIFYLKKSGYINISKTTTFFFSSFFTIAEYCFFSAYIYFNYKSKIFKKILIAGSFIFLAIAAYNLFFDTTHRFDSLTTSVESILMICYSIFYFYEELKTPENTFIYSTKTFWIIIAILLYLAGTFILFVSTAYMTAEEQSGYWPINNIANILKNILLSVAFILKVFPKNKFVQNIYNI